MIYFWILFYFASIAFAYRLGCQDTDKLWLRYKCWHRGRR